MEPRTADSPPGGQDGGDESAESPREFGTGWISGTLSVVLGAVGLLAVLCFHFPSLLTIPQAREHYPLPIIRGLLHLVLVAAFLLGFTSVMLRQNKTLGLIGMGLVLVAALLGGSRVEIQGELKDDYYLGLDYALLILVLYSIIFIPLEKVFGRLDQEVFRKGWRIDLAYFFISTMAVQLTAYLSLQPAFVLFDWAVNPQVQAAVRSQPYVLQFLEIAFLADFVQYWVHRLFHVISWLWPFHAVHHSGEVLDWMAGNRIHIVDLALTRSLIYVPAYVLGFSDLPIYCYIVFVALYSVFIHANLNFEFGPLRYVLVTPQFHHWHHGVEREAIDKNFAIHFPVLDMVFGTYYLPDHWPQGYGVHSNDVPEDYLQQWIYPFLPQQKKTDEPPASYKRRPDMPSLTIENYVKAIYLLVLRQEGRAATTGQLAQALGVLPGTVTSMLKTLAESGLAAYTPYEGVALTEAGRSLALRIVRRHRLVELFLAQTLDMPWDEVHEEAEHMEHAVSDHLIDRIDAFLGRPATDPHGDPIPKADGTVAPTAGQPLAEWPPGKPFRLVRVTNQAPEFLRELSDAGVSLGVTGRIERLDASRAKLDLTLAGRRARLDLESAQQMLVSDE